MSSPPRDIPASVRQRLLNLSRERDEDFQFVLTRFALERLLYRIGASDHAEQFLLKGALLFTVWSERIYRPTRDLDLAGRGEADLEKITETFRNLCQSPAPDDGLAFDPTSVKVERFREFQRYPGVRVHLIAHLSQARIPLRVDIGYGDAVTPSPTLVDYPTLLDHPVPRLKAYPRETVIAEKFQAMVLLGLVNSRIKDFYDLWVLATNFDFTGRLLASAIRATFERRQTPVPVQTPIVLTSEYSDDRIKRAAWKAFLRRSTRDAVPSIELSETCAFLEGFLMPPSLAVASGEPFEAEWACPGPWGRPE